jgi:hypothetical protein
MSTSNNKAAVGICLLSVFLFPVFASAAESYGPGEYYGDSSANPAFAGPFFVALLLAALALVVLQLVAMYKVFEKAGKPGWAAIVPIYNTWVLAEVGGKPGWMGLVAAVISFVPLIGPIVSLVLWFMINIGISKSFGRGTGFGVGLVFLPFIFFPILAFSRDTGSQLPATGPSSVLPISEETTPAQQQTPVHV